jgi:hypothetical protein
MEPDLEGMILRKRRFSFVLLKLILKEGGLVRGFKGGDIKYIKLG